MCLGELPCRIQMSFNTHTQSLQSGALILLIPSEIVSVGLQCVRHYVLGPVGQDGHHPYLTELMVPSEARRILAPSRNQPVGKPVRGRMGEEVWSIWRTEYETKQAKETSCAKGLWCEGAGHSKEVRLLVPEEKELVAGLQKRKDL